MNLPRRVWLGFLLAPLSAVAVLVVAGAVIARATPAQAWDASFFLALFGLPIAYAVELPIGLPLYARYRHAGVRRPTAAIVGVAAVTGAVVMPLVWTAFWGTRPEWLMASIGAAMGAAAGGTFVLAAGRALPASRHR